MPAPSSSRASRSSATALAPDHARPDIGGPLNHTTSPRSMARTLVPDARRGVGDADALELGEELLVIHAGEAWADGTG
jgi:hypothetical protein